MMGVASGRSDLLRQFEKVKTWVRYALEIVQEKTILKWLW